MANDKKFVARNGLQSQNIDFVSNNESNTVTLSVSNSGILSFDGNVQLLNNLYDATLSKGNTGEALFATSEGVKWQLPYAVINDDSTVYVSTNGNDTNDGKSWESSVLTIEKALEIANDRGELTLIDIAPGVYETEGHLDMPDNTVVRCAHRTVKIRPKAGFEERNVFRMGSGCFIEGPIFEDWRLDDLENPTEGFAISFRPGAVITRAPYAHKIAVRTTPYWTFVPPPLDRDNGNPLVGRGAGVVLADGSVCSPYSIYPNIMTWGATPVSHNGIGYCAKNGALINAVNAVSMWAHKHFLALNGGQIILSSCSTQFGDYTMVSSGSRQILIPENVTIQLTQESSSNTIIQTNANTIIDNLWIELDTTINPNTGDVWTDGWDEEDELFTRRDARTFLQSLGWVLSTGNEKPMLDFAKGLFDENADPVFTLDKQDAFVYSFEYMRDEIIALEGVTSNAANIVTALVSTLNTTITSPTTRTEPSTITAIGHTWTAIMAGVALTKIPPARNFATIEESILELNAGIVIASGQDDQGSALFIGGLKIDADTGELTGPPFDQSVNRIATRAAISRSF
jgi:hypothetical protein